MHPLNIKFFYFVDCFQSLLVQINIEFSLLIQRKIKLSLMLMLAWIFIHSISFFIFLKFSDFIHNKTSPPLNFTHVNMEVMNVF